jgi:hypothetical protein
MVPERSLLSSPWADTYRSHPRVIEGSPMIQRSSSYPIKMAVLVVCHISLLAALVWIF